MHHHHQLLQHNPHYSAFDTTLIRKTADSEYEYLPMANNTMHRPMSVPAYPHTTNQYSTYNNQNGHQYGSRMQALTADKNNLQLLCSILNNSFDPGLGAPTSPPPPPPPPKSESKSSGTTNTPKPIINMTAVKSKKRKLVTKRLATKMIAFSSITVNNRPAIIDRSSSRPYRCPISSCAKSYKNPNGLKYHAAHGHAADEVVVERPFMCTVNGCGKKYKNANGLKYHSVHAHDPYNTRTRDRHDTPSDKKRKKESNNKESDSDSEYSRSSHAEFLSDGPGGSDDTH